MKTLRSKLPQVGTTIFTVMTRMAQQHNAINLSQGFPDFDCPAALRERVSFYLNDRRNQYAPMTGVVELGEQIALKVAQLYGYQADADQEITVTSGATEALFDAIQAVISAGDEVIMFDPAYDSYDPAVQLAGGRPVRIPLRVPDYGIDWQALSEAINDRTRMIIINSPHNPSGSVLHRSDLDQLAELIRNRDILVLSDEVYEHMVFDGARHESVLSHAELRERSFAVFSFGKTYHSTGWKSGYCVAPPALTAEFRKVHQFVTFTSTSFIQYAIADFMRDCPEHHLELPAFYQQKRDAFCKLIAPSRFTFTPSAGTYFQCVDFSAISDLTDREFVAWLCQEHGVATIPLSPFYARAPGSSIIRFCFCKDDSTLEQAAEILNKL
ncbi:pyridoxal phosphate-dependent aminotransferase [Proteobacteria bacterium 005FR1]|nr:pyridoxal phosphate-dependent aminotransferase [Proteobacteria bacterium 005FR1]